MKNSFKSYAMSGIFMLYFGLKEDFVLLYNGIALVLAAAAFYQAFIICKKKNT